MNIGLDYDETITEDPEIWGKIIALFLASNHAVYIVSIRSEKDTTNHEVLDFAEKHHCPAFFTNGNQKKTFMLKKGIAISVWIDDAPELIPDGQTLFGTTVGCLRMGEPINPDHEIDAIITLTDKH